MKTKKINFTLAFIIFLAAFLRLFQLTNLPISLFNDEVDVGYQAWSLISTGRDYMGHLLPAYMQSLVEWRAPLLMYLTAPFTAILGPTVLAVRLPVALLGIFNVYLVYSLTKHLFSGLKPFKLSIFKLEIYEVAAFLLAITPWHIHYSRASFEVTLLLSLILVGVQLFITGKYYLSLLPFALCFYTYSTANIFIPLLVLLLVFIYKPKLNLRNNWPKLIPSFLIVLPIIGYLFGGQLSARFGSISIFSDQNTIDQVVITRLEPWVKSTSLDRVFNNKVTAIGSQFIKNYLQAFSPQFLFISGDPLYRQSIGNFGELLLISLPFLVFGLFNLITTYHGNATKKLILFWLLIAPLPSSLTIDGGMHATRLFIMLPPLVIITAFGFITLLSKLSHFSFFIVSTTLLLAVANISTYWYFYSAHYRYLSARYWHYGFEQILPSLKPYLSGSGKIYLDNNYEPILNKFAFYTAFPPKTFQQNKVSAYDSPLFSGYQFSDRIFFGKIKPSRDNAGKIIQLLQPGDVYFAVQGLDVDGNWDWSINPPEQLKVIDSVKDLYGNPLFYLVTPSTK